MGNQSGRAYGLTTLCPLRVGDESDQSFASLTRECLEHLPLHDKSPMAAVPNTYLCRFFVLNDVVYEGDPAKYDQLKSKYLVFTTNFHGELDAYLSGMWQHAESTIRKIWKYGYGFDAVSDAASFIRYIKKCQVRTTFYFNGSNDAPRDEQLKSLYLKQELSDFAFKNQGKSGEALQAAFTEFIERVQPRELRGPTWKPGAISLDEAVVGAQGGKQS